MPNVLRLQNEAVFVRGDTKYMSRGGKFYRYKNGTREEIKEAEYLKMLGPKVSGRPDVSAKAQNAKTVKVLIGGKEWKASHPDMSAKELSAKLKEMSDKSPKRAVQWLRQNCELSGEEPEVGEAVTGTDEEEAEAYLHRTSDGKENAEQKRKAQDKLRNLLLKEGITGAGFKAIARKDGTQKFKGLKGVRGVRVTTVRDGQDMYLRAEGIATEQERYRQKYDGTTGGLIDAIKDLVSKGKEIRDAEIAEATKDAKNQYDREYWTEAVKSFRG